jgi:hypothetical protein
VSETTFTMYHNYEISILTWSDLHIPVSLILRFRYKHHYMIIYTNPPPGLRGETFHVPVCIPSSALAK